MLRNIIKASFTRNVNRNLCLNSSSRSYLTITKVKNSRDKYEVLERKYQEDVRMEKIRRKKLEREREIKKRKMKLNNKVEFNE